MIEGLGEIFKEESQEILAELEAALLELEACPEDQELIGRVFRTLHTLKGSGGMAGFNDISAFAHEVETVFEEVRNGRLTASRELISLTLLAQDQIKKMVDAAGTMENLDGQELAQLIGAFRRLLDGGQPEAAPAVVAAAEGSEAPPLAAAPSAAGDLATYRIRFRLCSDIFSHGVNPLYLLRELAQLGEFRSIAHLGDIPELEVYDPLQCYLTWDVIVTTAAGEDAIRDVFIFVEDDCALQIDLIDAVGFDEDADYKRLGEILVERGDLTAADLRAALQDRRRLGELLVEKQLVSPSRIDAALVEQERVQNLREERRSVDATSSIRVKSEKLDNLVNLIGELVTIQARLSEAALVLQHGELTTVSEEVERLTWELRDQVLNIRMLPIGATFSRFKRLVRDLGEELGKDVQLVTAGADTELDKTVIERLQDPLVHLIRNCIDHGIEAPEARQRQGKPRQGTVYLSATHVGAHVLLQVRDDGAGLDPQRLRRKGEELGLLTGITEASDKELFNLILSPGFSTAGQVTSVSGRGVGMDVVKQAVDALRGSIDIGSKLGQGTTFTVKLPLTLAIIDGLLVSIDGGHFVMPLAAVEECIELTRTDAARSHGRNLLQIRGEVVPFVRLREHFDIDSEAPEIEQVVVVNVDGQRLGFAVDYVVGEHQTVIKSLGKLYQHLKGVSGATILGNGTVALILDLGQLAQAELARELAVTA